MQIDSKEKVRVTTKDFESKFRSKNEVYTLMTLDLGAHLPRPECVTIYFLKDLALSKKKRKFWRVLHRCSSVSRY